jgi:hypothetical protein
MRYPSHFHFFRLLVFLLLGPLVSHAGIIKGRVSGTNNEALAFANVAVRGTATSTGSNDQGQYQLRVPAGQYQLVFQYVGYRPRTETVRVPAGDSTVVLNVALVPESYNLTEVTVRGSDRDPAYAIIQQAQQWRAYHQREVATFQSRLYIKSLIRLSETPSKVFGLFKMGPDIKPGILYLSESLSDIRFTQPNTIKERMISSRVSGDSRGISFNRAQGGLNFYDNVLKPSFSQRGFVSPVANNSFLFYQYELVGTTQQGGEVVHKIKIIPRRRTDPVFSGFIYIVEGSWRIHSVDVRLTKDAQLDYVDDLHIEQLFAPAPGVPHVWTLQSQKLSVNFSAFGFKGSGYATAVFSNYNHVAATYPAPPEAKKTPVTTPAIATQPSAPPVIAPVTTKELTRQIRRQKPDLTGLNKQVRRQVKQARRDSIRNDPFAQMKTGEVMLAEKGVNERDSSYWSQIRPVPLTDEEKQDYHKKDSSEVIRNSRPYQDSLDRKRNEFTPSKLLLSGYTHRNTFRKRSIAVQPIFNELQYNTVEGYVLNAQATYAQRTDNRRFITLTPTLRYGFSNHQLQPSLTINWQLDPVKLRQIGLIAGRTIENFDRNSQLTPFINSVYSLLVNRNYTKLYRRDGAEISYFWEPVNGLTMRGAISYFDRHELENTSTYLWHDVPGRAFTPNQPIADESPDGTGFGRSKATTLTLSVSYRPGTTYITRPDGKYNLGTKYPTFNAQIRQGVSGILGANVRYTLLQGSIRQNVQLGLLGTSSYEAVLGGFVGSTANLTFIDYRHFSGNRTILTGNFSDFQLLDYYQYSTKASYFEGHFNHHFNGFIFNKIPLIKSLKWQEVLSLNYLQTAQSGPYLELGAGIEHIFKLGRIDFFTALQRGEHVASGVRIGLGI